MSTSLQVLHFHLFLNAMILLLSIFTVTFHLGVYINEVSNILCNSDTLSENNTVYIYVLLPF